MHKNLKIVVMILLTIFITNIKCFALSYEYNKNVWIDNIREDNIKIQIVDVDTKREEININERYSAYAIVTLKVSNDGIYDIELANIDIEAFQGEKSIKYFVSTSNDNITGFIGNLKSKESKIVKIGVTLHNLEEVVRLEMSNINDYNNKKDILNIDIK